MRIARALAFAGVAARRKCELFVQRGEVAVNGEIVRDLSRQVDPQRDRITFRGRRLSFPQPVYFLLHKPAGYATTVSDPHAPRTVYRLLPPHLVGSHAGRSQRRVFPVGRLDLDSSGLLLFTNDGALAHRLTHPRYGVAKEYEVELDRPLGPADREQILRGVPLEDGLARAETLVQTRPRRVRLTLREGRKREVRRIFRTLGYRVVRLCRISFGPLRLGDLPLGRGRFLTPKEVALLKRTADSSRLPDRRSSAILEADSIQRHSSRP